MRPPPPRHRSSSPLALPPPPAPPRAGRLLSVMARGALAALAFTSASTAAMAAVATAATATASVGVSSSSTSGRRPWHHGSHHPSPPPRHRSWPHVCFVPPLPLPSRAPSSSLAGARGFTSAARVVRMAAGLAGGGGGGGGKEQQRWSRDRALLITSGDNPRVKYMKAVGKKKKEREKEGVVLLEGHRLLADAMEAGHRPLQVLVCPEAFDAPRGQQLLSLLETLPAATVTLCAPNLVAAACDTVSPQGVVAVIPRPASTPGTATTTAGGGSGNGSPPLCLVMDGLQDPGNVGTLLRTAVACGVTEIMMVQGCDPWSPKALRSAMGATFKAPRVSEAGSWEEAKAALQARWGPGLRFVAADGGEGFEEYDAIDWTGPSALIVGNEGNGLSPAVRTALSQGAGVTGGKIPLAGGIESLNAGAAGAIILAEAARQRRRGRGK